MLRRPTNSIFSRNSKNEDETFECGRKGKYMQRSRRNLSNCVIDGSTNESLIGCGPWTPGIFFFFLNKKKLFLSFFNFLFIKSSPEEWNWIKIYWLKRRCGFLFFKIIIKEINKKSRGDKQTNRRIKNFLVAHEAAKRENMTLHPAGFRLQICKWARK